MNKMQYIIFFSIRKNQQLIGKILRKIGQINAHPEFSYYNDYHSYKENNFDYNNADLYNFYNLKVIVVWLDIRDEDINRIISKIFNKYSIHSVYFFITSDQIADKRDIMSLLEFNSYDHTINYYKLMKSKFHPVEIKILLHNIILYDDLCVVLYDNIPANDILTGSLNMMSFLIIESLKDQ